MALLGLGGVVSAAVIGQTDTFSGGTTEGWFVPGPSPVAPSQEPDGGPGGAGDGYLKLQATGAAGPGSNLSVLNETQWAGNYTAAGIGWIQMDVRNFGPSDVYLRLLFEDFDGPGPPVNLALSANAIFVPAGGDWTTVSFPVTEGHLAPGGLGTVAGALASVDVLRIFHTPAAAFPGPGVGPEPVNVVLGVDNITAVAIPEPGTWGFAIMGLGALLAVRRARAR